MPKFISDSQSTQFPWPWISAFVGSVLFLICLTGLVILLTGTNLTPKSKGRTSSADKQTFANWKSQLNKYEMIRSPQKTNKLSSDTKSRSSGHERSDYFRASLAPGEANLPSTISSDQPTLRVHNSQFPSYADTDHYRHLGSPRITRYAAITPEDTSSFDAQMTQVTNPTSFRWMKQLDPYYRDLNYTILRYFKSVLQRMTDDSLQSGKEKVLDFLIRYSRYASDAPKHRYTRSDKRLSLATLLRRSILNDIFNELDYNGDGTISRTELDLFLRFHEILP